MGNHAIHTAYLDSISSVQNTGRLKMAAQAGSQGRTCEVGTRRFCSVRFCQGPSLHGHRTLGGCWMQLEQNPHTLRGFATFVVIQAEHILMRASLELNVAFEK